MVVIIKFEWTMTSVDIFGFVIYMSLWPIDLKILNYNLKVLDDYEVLTSFS